jgi:hypothetical protein
MKSSFIVLLLCAAFSFAQDNNPAASSDHSKQNRGFVTVTGPCKPIERDYCKRLCLLKNSFLGVRGRKGSL